MSAQKQNEEAYRFGEFQLNAARRLLLQRGVPVTLPPRQLSLLLVLVKAADRIVSKEELYRAVWGERIVTEQNLTVQMAGLRDVFGRDLIATFPRRGYKLMASVSTISVPLSDAAAIAAPPLEPLPAGARKFVTLLRADLVDTTGVVMKLPPERMRTRLEPPLAALHGAIRRFGGTRVKEYGAGVLAAFGAPLADDLHAPRACHAAVAALEEVGRLADGAWHLRAALHTGTVLATAAASAAGCDLDGAALLFVEQLKSAAPAGRIYLSEECLHLVEGYVAAEPDGTLALEGSGAPVPIHRLRNVRTLSSWRVRSQRVTVPFVGRDAELTGLWHAAKQARMERGQPVLVLGEAGIGKSRLVHEFAGKLREAGWQFIDIACSPISQAASYAVIRDLVAGVLMLAVPGAASMEAAIADPATALPALWQAALRSVLDLDAVDDAWRALEPVQRGRAISDAVRAVVEAAVLTQPTLLLVEDLHWLDQASDLVIAALMPIARRHPILILLTSRPEGAPTWFERHDLTRIWVPPLDEAAATALIGAVLSDRRTADRFTARIRQHTGCVPLFIEEVCRELANEERPIEPDRADWILVPPTVQGVIAARIDRLPPAERVLLQQAAAIGPKVPVALLHTVSELDDAVFRDRLDVLDSAGLLIDERLLPEHEAGFAHELVRQVAYESILLPARRSIHEQILAALEATSDAADRRALLCHHAIRAEAWRKAAQHGHAVARKSMEQSAYADAAAHFEIALDALDRLPETVEREQEAIDLRLEARGALTAIGRLEDYLDLATAATQRAAEIHDDGRRLAATAIRAIVLNFVGTPDEAIEAGEAAVRHAAQQREGGWLTFAEYTLGQGYLFAGRCRQASNLFGAAFDRLTGDEPQVPPGASLESFTALTAVMKSIAHSGLGEMSLANRFQRRAMELAQATARPYDHVASEWSAGILLLGNSEASAAQDRLGAALELAREHEMRIFLPLVSYQLGRAYLKQNQIPPGLNALEMAYNDAQRIGPVGITLQASLYMALACAGDDREAALRQASAVRERARQQGFEVIEAEALFIEAEIIANGEGDMFEAAQKLERAIAISFQVEAVPLVTEMKALQRRIRNAETCPQLID